MSIKILKHAFRAFTCSNCKHEKKIKTNHEDACLDYCQSCSWKPSEGDAFYIPALGRQAYRKFIFSGEAEK